MSYLAVAVTIAILLTVLNLLLTFGVIRKLRVHDARLASGAGTGIGPDATLPAGSTVATVAATTVDGRAVSSVRPDAGQLVGFFSPGCGACEERIPEFLRYHERTGVAALAVVVGDPAGSDGYVERLTGGVDVVVEAEDGPLATAFAVTSFPALCLVDQTGAVIANGNGFERLPESVPV